MEDVMAARDGLDAEYSPPEREEKAKPDYWASHFVRRIPTPKWQTRHEGLPTLAQPNEINRVWRMHFGTGSMQDVETFAFEVKPKAVVRFIGVAVPKSGRPTAWLIYFRHTAQPKDFNGNLLEMGAGDYLMGRMQVVKQLAL